MGGFGTGSVILWVCIPTSSVVFNPVPTNRPRTVAESMNTNNLILSLIEQSFSEFYPACTTNPYPPLQPLQLHPTTRCKPTST